MHSHLVLSITLNMLSFINNNNRSILSFSKTLSSQCNYAKDLKIELKVWEGNDL